MNAPRATAEQTIQFLIGSPTVVSATEAARSQPHRPNAPAHDAFTRLLHRLEPDPAALWDEVRPLLDPTACTSATPTWAASSDRTGRPSGPSWNWPRISRGGPRRGWE